MKPEASNNQSRKEEVVSPELLSEVQAPDVEGGLDFYNEVARFEINLIRRALIFTGGHQGKAAWLLNLPPQTLNTKIKHYQIRLGRLQ